MQAPLVEKDAGAEVLVWRAHLLDEFLSRNTLQRVFYHYVRLKIFTEKGKEQASTIDLVDDGTSKIIDVSGRTVKADGTVLELERSAVHERDVVRAAGRKLKVTSFAMPGVEAGAIVEYRWREVLNSTAIRYVRLQFQREFPVQKVSYFVKPLSREVTDYQMRLQSFNCEPTPFKVEQDGYNSTTLENIPAFREEPFGPSEPNLRAWALLYYQSENPKDPDRYWSEIGKKTYQELKGALKTNDEVKAATTKAIAQAASDQDKIVSLIRYIQGNLRNINDPAVTASERERFYEGLPKDRIRNSAEILKVGIGTSYELNVVFAAMAAQAGLDARPALVADWNDVAFNPKTMTDQYYIDSIAMAVKLGDFWKVYDVSTNLLTPGILPWRHEGVFALVSDPRAPFFVQTQHSPATASVEAKLGDFTLSADGELEGDVEESFTGHRALDRRMDLRGESEERMQEWLRARVTEMFPDAEVTAIAIKNAGEPRQPLNFSYHLRAPHYAQVAGRRIFFQVLPFEKSHGSPFTASERRTPVRFPYAWMETAKISIKPPAGFVFDNPSSPGGMSFGAAGGYNLKISVAENGTVTTTRELTFGGLYVEPKDYPVVRQVFAEIQKRDSHTLALIQSR